LQTESGVPALITMQLLMGAYGEHAHNYLIGGVALNSRQTWIYNERYCRIMAVNAFIKTILCHFVKKFSLSTGIDWREHKA